MVISTPEFSIGADAVKGVCPAGEAYAKQNIADKTTPVLSCVAVSPDRAAGVPGPTRQSPPERGRPSPMSDFIANGEWGPAFNAQNKMLDEHSKKYNLQAQDWRKQKPWYKPSR